MVRCLAVIVFLTVASGLCAGSQPETLRTLVEQFDGTKTFFQQIEIARKIVALHDSSVLPQLEPWLTNGDRHLRANAAFIFASLGDSRGFDVIVGILDDRSERPKGQGVAVRSGYWSVSFQIAADRYYAAHVLGDLKDRRAVPILVPLLRDTEVRDIVPWALGQIGDRSAIQPLIEALKDRDPSLRVLVIYALQDFQATEAVPSLRTLLDDTDRSTFGEQVRVADAARAAIAKLETKPR
jgi:HEAT repeat protein